MIIDLEKQEWIQVFNWVGEKSINQGVNIWLKLGAQLRQQDEREQQTVLQRTAAEKGNSGHGVRESDVPQQHGAASDRL
jgi:hypothetical protein